MEPESATPVRVASESAARSPLSPARIVDLLFRPGRFFATVSLLTRKPEVLFVAWISGISYVMDKIDTRIMQGEVGSTTSTAREQLTEWLTKSWTQYWVFALAVGVINAWILWYVAGWWYRMRLVWSGALNPDPRQVRSVYMYQTFVMAAPTTIITIVETTTYSNYAEAWAAENWWSICGLVFVFWSCATSYKAATVAFTLAKWKARLWFLVLPIAYYLVAIGVIGTLYMLADGDPS